MSIIIRDPVEKFNRSGINCLKFEKKSTRSDQTNLDRLYTAGRDSTIRVYSNLVPNTNDPSRYELNDVDQYYQMSLSHHTDWVNDIIVCKNNSRCNFWIRKYFCYLKIKKNYIKNLSILGLKRYNSQNMEFNKRYTFDNSSKPQSKFLAKFLSTI